MEKVHKYPNDKVNVVWKPEKCTHSGICVKLLPNVYHPKEKPWIKCENVTDEELINQIKQCPSGALSYEIKKEK